MPMSVDALAGTLYTCRITSQGLGTACIRHDEEVHHEKCTFRPVRPDA